MQARAHQFLFLIPLLVAGCSARVSATTEKRSPSETTESVEKFETKVGIDVLADREDPDPAPVPENIPVPEQPPTPPETEGKAVEVSGTANFAVIVEGDLHLHEHYHEHLHLENPPRSAPKRIKETPEPIQVEAQQPRLDPRCERLLREHEERVKEWMAMMGR